MAVRMIRVKAIVESVSRRNVVFAPESVYLHGTRRLEMALERK